MKKIFLLFTTVLIVCDAFSQETFPVNGVSNKNHTIYAFTNAKIIVDADETIENGTMVIQDGIIKAVGTKINLPQGAVIYDLKGKSIYPGLIDAYTSYGMQETKRSVGGSYPQTESNTKGAYGWNQAVRPETEAVKVFTKDSKSAEEFRKMGFGAVLTFQKEGIVRGSGAVVALGENKENELIISSKATAMYSFDKGTSSQDYPSSLMGSIALLRQTYLDASWYSNDKTASTKEFNISLDAFNNLQTLPQIFETTDKLNALRADKIGDEFKMNYIIKGSGNEYQLIDDIKASNCKFIIPLNFPMAYDVEDAYDAANISLTELK
ncbi:MAG: amidohydrolase, partial [Bacteroidetes bacterium]|nr:amidohydrolase [Bacteroidota bacterium]